MLVGAHNFEVFTPSQPEHTGPMTAHHSVTTCDRDIPHGLVTKTRREWSPIILIKGKSSLIFYLQVLQPFTFNDLLKVSWTLNSVWAGEQCLTCGPSCSANTKRNHSRDLLSTRLLWINNKICESIYVVSKIWELNKLQW